ncbi:MAG: glycerol kinase GlpK [Bacteroidota bacterium]
MSHLLAIDQGTTGTTTLLFDEKLVPVARAYRELTQHYPQPGWVEQDPLEIRDGVLATIRECLKDQVPAAIGITNQRETTILWDRTTGLPLTPAIVWQCRRTTEICEQVRRFGFENAIRTRTGLVLDPYFSATKIAWLLDHYELRDAARLGKVAFGTVDSWLLYCLTGGKVHSTDHANASRTLLYNLYEQQWDEELLAIFSVPASILPEIRENAGLLGETDVDGIPRGIPICGMAGDQQAALFGQHCFQPGMAKNTYGTGCFLLANTGSRVMRPKHGLLSTVAWKLKGNISYALEGSVFVAGSAVQWLRDGLGIIERASESEELALQVPDTGGVYLVPAFVGLGAPHWDPHARGTLVGITRGTNKAHLARATLEAIAYQSYDLIEQMRQDGASIAELRVDGGASNNNLLMQFQSDILGLPVIRRSMVESTALGAAMLAGLGAGIWETPEQIPYEGEETRFSPTLPPEQCQAMLAGWQEAVNRSRGWAKCTTSP